MTSTKIIILYGINCTKGVCNIGVSYNTWYFFNYFFSTNCYVPFFLWIRRRILKSFDCLWAIKRTKLLRFWFYGGKNSFFFVLCKDKCKQNFSHTNSTKYWNWRSKAGFGKWSLKMTWKSYSHAHKSIWLMLFNLHVESIPPSPLINHF